MKLSGIKVSRMRNATYFQFLDDIKELIEECGAEAMRIVPQYKQLLASLGRMASAIKKISKSAFTQQIKEKDKARDEAWSGLAYAVKAASKRRSPAIREEARKLAIFLKACGRVPRKTFNDETAAIHSAVQSLDGKYAPSVAATGVAPWIEELKELNAEFKSLLKDRYGETACKSDIAMKDARKKADAAYKQITEHISAFIVSFGKADYEKFARKHNLLIAEYKAMLGRSKAKKEEKKK